MNSAIYPFRKLGLLSGAILTFLLAVILPAWTAPAAFAADPVVVISTPASGAFLPGPTAALAFTVDANGQPDVECDLDTDVVGPVPCDSEIAHLFSGLSAGTHTATVTATDNASRTGTDSVTFTIDETAPVVSISAPTSNQLLGASTVTASFGITEDNLGLVECQLDAGAPVACDSSNGHVFSGVADGVHSLTVTTTDLAGRSAAASVSFTVDTTAPVLTIDSPSDGAALASNDVSVEFSSTDASTVTYECSVDGGAFSTCSSPLVLSDLPDATYSVEVRAEDELGHFANETIGFIVDTSAPAAPSVTRTAPTADPTNSSSQTLTYSGAEPGGSFECRLDGSSFTACPASPVTLASLSDGSHTYSVRQIDAAGNQGSVASVTWTIDTVAPSAPTVSRVSPTASPTNSTSQEIQFSAAEGGGTLECRLDATTFAACPSSPTTLTSLADGSRRYEVRQTDAAGNIGAVGSVTWTVDTIAPNAPTVMRTAPTADPTNSTSQTISYSGAEPGGTFECKLDSAAFAACTASPVSLSSLADGSHTYSVRQIDAAGNEGSIASVTWTVDTVAPAEPTVTRTAPTADPVSSTSQTISYSGAEGGGTFQCRLDSAAFSACSASPVTLSGLVEGSHTFRVRQVDAAGNLGAIASVTWTVDTIAPNAPTVMRTAPTASPTNSTSQEISFTAAEGGGTLECKLDSASYASCPASPVTLTGLADGSHTYSVRQTDAAGNIGAVGSVTWTVDTIAPNAPTVTRTAPTADPTNSTSQTISYTGAEPGGTLECKLDSGSFSPCPISPVTINDLTDGSHTATVRQIDAAGNVGAEQSVTWTVDTDGPPAPTVTRTSPTANPTNSTSQTITYSGNESGGTFLCKLDSAPYAACPSSPVTLIGLTHGTHTYFVRQVDASGNPGAIGSVTWTVDTVAPNAPTVSRTSPTANPTNSTSQTISFTAAEGGGTLECKLDSASYAACPASPLTLTSLADGSHTYSVRQTDAAGNIGAVGSVTWTVDTIAPDAPTVTRTTPSASPTNSTTQAISYSGAEGGGTYQCRLDSAAFSACSSSPVSLSGLGNGARAYSVRQTDAAGNIGDPTTVSWVIDTVDPSVSIGSPASGGFVNVDESPNASFTASDTHLGNVTCELNGSPVSCPNSSGSNYTYSIASLADGTHDFDITVTDTAGNVTPVSGSFVVDTISPAVSISSPSTNSFLAVDDVSKTFSRSDVNLDAVECSLDGATYSACTSPVAYSNLDEGMHTAKVRATDRSGNATERTVQFTIDTIAPVVTVTSPSVGEVVRSSDVAVAFAGDDATALTYECKTGDGPFGPCGNPFAITGLDDGTYTTTIRATDRAGNTNTGGVQFSVDLTSPDRTETFGIAKPKGKTPLKLTKRSRLIFRDEFSDPSVNRRKWSTLRGTLKFPYSSSYNVDKEAASYSRNNVAIENGKAVLTLKRKPEGEDPGHPYSSGMLHSGNHFSFKHGYVEARVKVPRCSGCWPAFWMLNAPVDEEWPPEIDIFEFFNTLKDKRPKFNVHWKAGGKNKQWGSKKYGDVKRDYTGGWHTYGLAWSSKRAQTFVDGKPGPIFKTSRLLPKKANYLIFNLALKKGFSPTGERKMAIDYVRVWK